MSQADIQPSNLRCVVKSGPMYLVEIEDNAPIMALNPNEASQYDEAEALKMMGLLTEIGWNAELLWIEADD